MTVEPAVYSIQFVPNLFTGMKQIQEKEDDNVREKRTRGEVEKVPKGAK